jgi:hypothetical protein
LRHQLQQSVVVQLMAEPHSAVVGQQPFSLPLKL